MSQSSSPAISPLRRPDYRTQLGEVLLGARRYAAVEADAIDAMAALPPQSVDLIFADPPYNLSNGGTTCRGGKRVSVDKAAWDESRGLLTDHAFHMRWLAAAQRVLKPSGTLWVSGTQHVIFSLGWAMQVLGYRLLNTVTWFKPNASPNLARRQFTHSTELVIWASPSKRDPLPHTFNYGDMRAANGGKQMRDVWELPADGEGVVWTIPAAGAGERNDGGKHPTQKPVALLERIVLASSLPGHLVFDPFVGSGTTGTVAVRHGRRFVGSDLDPECVDNATARIGRVTPIALEHQQAARRA